MISRASLLFQRLAPPQPYAGAGTVRGWAQLLGVSVASVGAYRTGDRSPNNATRQRIREETEKLGAVIPEEAWDERPSPEELAPPPRPPRSERPPRPATSDDPAELGGRLRQLIEDLYTELEDPEAGPKTFGERAQAVDRLASAADKLSRITGVRLTERQILASPLWKDLLERIVTALEPWPDAMRAVAKATEPGTKDPKA